MKTDWAQKLIKELKASNLVNDDCTSAFVAAYKNGDSHESWVEFEAAAERSEQFHPNCYTLLIFADGSCYADWKQGIEMFYPNIMDLRAEDEEVDERLTDTAED